MKRNSGVDGWMSRGTNTADPEDCSRLFAETALYLDFGSHLHAGASLRISSYWLGSRRIGSHDQLRLARGIYERTFCRKKDPARRREDVGSRIYVKAALATGNECMRRTRAMGLSIESRPVAIPTMEYPHKIVEVTTFAATMCCNDIYPCSASTPCFSSTTQVH